MDRYILFVNTSTDYLGFPLKAFIGLKYLSSTTIDLFFEKKDEISSLRSVNKIEESPYKLFQVKDGLCRGFFEHYHGIEKYSNLPRQTFPQTYKANGHIDIIKKETLRYGDAFGTKICAHIGNPIADIDSVEDFKYTEYQIKTKEINLINKKGELNE